MSLTWHVHAQEGAESDRVFLIRLANKGPACTTSPGSGAFEDFPLYSPYINTLESMGGRVRARLKWQNAVSIQCEPTVAVQMAALPFVAGVGVLPRPLPRHDVQPAARLSRSLRPGNYGFTDSLLVMHQMKPALDTIAARGMTAGQGVTIAFLDDSFLYGNALFLPLRETGRIVDQWDFVADAPQAAFMDSLGDSHGAQTSSLVCGLAAGEYTGIAPAVSLLVYRCEDGSRETTVEEDYVAAGIERAVDSGAQVINISLGYRYGFDDQDDHPFERFNGRTLPASVAAAAAGRRNVLVCVSLGNEGFGAVPTLGSPADADSILSVGAVEWDLATKTGYSSIGPTADRRIKPDVCATGYAPVAMSYTTNGTMYNNGTSFSSPIVAGACVLLRQLFPAASAAQIRQALKETALNAQSPDTLVGWGCINTAAAMRLLSQQLPVRPQISSSRHPVAMSVRRLYGGCRVLLSGVTVPVELFDCQGRRVALQYPSDRQVQFDNLRSGLWVVKAGNLIQKITVP